MMNTNSPVLHKDHKDKLDFLVKVNSEKQLWALIHSEGLLHFDVQNLYRKVRINYENFILNDRELMELQDAEYSLWKLHYKHIDEFRKQIKKKCSANGESTRLALLQYTEGFKLFVSEATEFYQKLISQVRKYYGLAEDNLFYRKGDICTSEPKKLQKCQYLCHRLFVCLGDLARYKEVYEKPDIKNYNWSIAATYYLESTRIWPDSGSPQNQLAVLATYIGEDFLALYHCVRSLAVKEPFPDAWDNLILLFERNRSSDLQLLPKEVHFDFSKPFERSSIQTEAEPIGDCSSCESSEAEHGCYSETNLWSSLIRTISFFFLKSSLNDFPCAFASTMNELEALMNLDKNKLEAALESYQNMNSSRTGPYRALQVVAVFIYVILNLTKNSELKELKRENRLQHFMLTELALAATFIIMGRFVDRCLQASPLDSSPLLPAVLVFVEWLVNMPQEVDTCGINEKTEGAISYFFCAFINLLNHFQVKIAEVDHPESMALWEDYELRGFAPAAHSHEKLDFSTSREQINSYKNGNKYRTHRILTAARKIGSRSKDSQKWLFYDKVGQKFHISESNSNTCPERRESEKEECNRSNLKQTYSVHAKSVEEDEVILLKPLTRHNTVPFQFSVTKDYPVPEGIWYQTEPSDECLQRATSVLTAQNQTQCGPSGLNLETVNFRCNKPPKHPVVRNTVAQQFSDTPITAGPPSLSGWVLNRGNFSTDREKDTCDIGKLGTQKVDEEIVYESLTNLSISESETTVIESEEELETTNFSSHVYPSPVPSAPLLPDDAKWCSRVPSSVYGYNTVRAIDHTNSYSNWMAAPRPPDYDPSIPYYPPMTGMTSSEWLRQYREKHKLERFNSNICPPHISAPSTLDYFDQWGNPLVPPNPIIYTGNLQLHSGYPVVYNVDEQRRDRNFHAPQMPTPYKIGAVTDVRDEQKPILQYLREREWLLNQDPSLRAPFPAAFMNN